MNKPFWYSLTYTTSAGKEVRCRNLGTDGATQIENAQSGLGSHSFQRILQPRHYSQYELDMWDKANAQRDFVSKLAGKNGGSL